MNDPQLPDDPTEMLVNLSRDLHFTYLANYAKNERDLLTLLCDKYGSDKGEIDKAKRDFPWDAHTYTDYYSSLFSHCRTSIKKVFECGIGTTNLNYKNNMDINGKPGASLRMWRDYFRMRKSSVLTWIGMFCLKKTASKPILSIKLTQVSLQTFGKALI